MAMVTKPCPGDPATHPSTRTEVRIIPTIAMPRAGDPVTLHTTPTEVPARQSSTTAPYHTNRGPTHPTNHPPEVPARQSIALHRSRRGPPGCCDLCSYRQPPPPSHLKLCNTGTSHPRSPRDSLVWRQQAVCTSVGLVETEMAEECFTPPIIRNDPTSSIPKTPLPFMWPLFFTPASSAGSQLIERSRTLDTSTESA